LQKRHAERELDFPDQVGQNDQASGQDGDDRQRPTLIVGLDLLAQLADSLVDRVLGDQDLHGVPTLPRSS
jgi:hypothetical protein